MTSVTVKAYPNYPAFNFTMMFSLSKEEATKNNNTNFFDLLANMYGELVNWSDNYINGYFTWAPASYLAGGLPSTGPRPLELAFTGWGHDVMVSKLNLIMAPFTEKLNSIKGISGSFSSQQLSKVSDLLGKGRYECCSRRQCSPWKD